ncbi:hypothetical protein FQN54_000685 [Arachnomyces sp. PD_36]|nr:hypothetical protein FQN54_000685 [Arachnomyces sp. PD_36]
MGNSSSTPANKERRRSNRLSKPPTDPSTLNYRRASLAQQSQLTVDSPSLKPVDLPSNSSRADVSTGEAPTVYDGSQKRHSRPGLGRRQSSQESEFHVRSRSGSLVGGVPDRVSRSKSALSNLPDPILPVLPVVEGPSVVDRSSLSLVPELEPVLHDPYIQDVQGNNIETLQSPVIGPGVSPSPELLSEYQFTSGRRRSLQTPGIATRTPSGHFRPYSHAEAPKPRRRAHSGYDYPAYPNVYPPVQQDIPPPQHHVSAPQPRVSTPTQLKYQQLGGLKPGSLRIMNGHPPTPNDEARRDLSNPLSSEAQSNRVTSNINDNLPINEPYSIEPNPSGYYGNEESGLGLQFVSQANPASLEPSQSSYYTGIESREDRTSPEVQSRGDSVPPQYPPQGTDGFPPKPVEEARYRFLDSPFSFELTPTRMDIPMITEVDDDQFEDEGVDISQRSNEDQESVPEQNENDSGKDSISSLKDSTAQPLKKADSGYSSATSAHSRRNNSRHGRVGMDAPEECENFSEKVSGWNITSNSHDYNEGWQPGIETPLPENDVISQPSRSSSQQFNTYHTSRSASHLRSPGPSMRSATPSRKQSVEVGSNRISFQNSFSTPHLVQEEQTHDPAATHHREFFQPETPPVPLELTAKCGCVLRFHNVDDSHPIHSPSVPNLTPRHQSITRKPVPAPPAPVETVPQTQDTCSCGSPMLPPSTTHPSRPNKLSRRRRSSGMSQVSDAPQDPIPTQRPYPTERRKSSDTPRSNNNIRRSLPTGSTPQLSRPKSFTSLGSQASPSEYREQPLPSSREPSIWGADDTTSLYSDTTTNFTRTRGQADNDSIPPIPPLPLNIKPKKSVSEHLGLKAGSGSASRDSQPRKLVKPQKGSSRHPRDSRLMVHGDF